MAAISDSIYSSGMLLCDQGQINTIFKGIVPADSLQKSTYAKKSNAWE